jgi:hypothetical protein
MRKRLFFRRVHRAHHLFAGHRPPPRCHPSRPSLMGSRRGKTPDQGIDIPFLSRAWPAPPRRCSSAGAGHVRDGMRGTVVGGHRRRRTPERPGLRSHAGAWERAAANFPGAPCTSSPRAHARRRRGEKFFAPTHPARMVANGTRGAPYRKTTGYARSRVGCAVRTMCEGPFRNDGVAVVHRPLGGASR